MAEALSSGCGARSSLAVDERGHEGGGGAGGGGDTCATLGCEEPPSACFARTGTCFNGVCRYAYADGASCDDGDLCTTGDSCASGVCAGRRTGCTTFLSAAENHTCAAVAGGAVQCWGSNASSQLGNNITAKSLVPLLVPGLASGGVAVSAGAQHTCALTSDAGVTCWGANASGQLGNDTTIGSLGPVSVLGLSSGVVAVSAGGAHTCALLSGGAVTCWGDNLVGQLGNGTTTGSLVPGSVIGLSSGIAAISAGGTHTCAVTSNGEARCWGDNGKGQLGNGTTTGSLAPEPVTGLSSGVVAVSAGGAHTCALTATGAVLCWGDNGKGQLGNGTTTVTLVPTPVSGLASGVLAVTAGRGHTCALTSAGAAVCWGENFVGQLGNDSWTPSTVPVSVAGLSSGVVTLSAGGLHTCALTSAGHIKCWGFNGSGELGNNSTTGSITPVDVVGY